MTVVLTEAITEAMKPFVAASEGVAGPSEDQKAKMIERQDKLKADKEY